MDIQEICNLRGVTNCYLLPDDIRKSLDDGILHCHRIGDNTALLIDKATCCRLYYYIIDFETSLELPENRDYLCEIIYRGNNIPEKEIEYLQKIGFTNSAERTLFQLLYKDIKPYTLRSGFEIRYAKNIEEVEEACLLFNATFDHFSGDFITPEEYKSLFDENSITVAIDKEGKIAGAFHHDQVKGIAWGRHVAVKGDYRGRSLGKDLLYDYIERYHIKGANRFMLWCLTNNTSAIRMYETTGFKSIGRNCISMIKRDIIKQK